MTIEEKIEELEEVAQILHTINEGLRVNGFFEDNTTVYVDKKQDKFVIIGKQKLRELADLLKKFPCGHLTKCKRSEKGERIYCHQCEEPEHWKKGFEKKFVEAFGESAKKET